MRLSQLYEAFTRSRSRALHHSRPGRSFCTITAWRGEYDRATNNRRNQQLLDDLHAQGLTARPVKGGYIEAGPDGKPSTPVHENSFFVFGQGLSDQELLELLHQLGNKYEQDSILFKPAQDYPTPDGVLPANSACLVMSDGEILPLGPFTAADSQYYTGLKGDASGKGQLSRVSARYSFGEPVPIEGRLVLGYCLLEQFDSTPTGRRTQHYHGLRFFGG